MHEPHVNGSSNAVLRDELADLGYVVGRNLVLEERYANGDPARVTRAHCRTSRP